MKVPLLRRRWNRWTAWPPNCVKYVPMTSARPYAVTRGCTMVHRSMSGGHYYHPDGSYSHSVIEAWCGYHLLRKNGLLLLDRPLEDMPVCATCEGRAIGAGQLGSREIAGNPVTYHQRVRKYTKVGDKL